MTPPFKNCVYCNQDAPYSPLPDLEIHQAKVYFCHECHAEYIYWRDGNLASHSLYTNIGDRTYRCSFSEDSCQLWYIEEPGIPAVQINHKMKMLKSFAINSDAPITPQNINQKISMLLVLL